MSQFNVILDRLNSNRDVAYSLIRIFLGGALFIRGIILAADPGAFMELARQEKLHMWFSYVTIGHLAGGFLIMIGLFTRLSALFQLPILISAVIVVHAGGGLMVSDQSLELALLVLFLLFIFTLFGSGPFALDKYIQKKKLFE